MSCSKNSNSSLFWRFFFSKNNTTNLCRPSGTRQKRRVEIILFFYRYVVPLGLFGSGKICVHFLHFFLGKQIFTFENTSKSQRDDISVENIFFNANPNFQVPEERHISYFSKSNFNFLFFIPFVFLFFCSCQNSSSTAAPVQISPIKETIIDQLKRPWSMDFITEDMVIVAQKDGELLRVNLSTKERFPIQGFPNDLADSIQMVKGKFEAGVFPRDADGYKTKYNAGIFEVLLDPDFKKNDRIYVSYVAENEERKSTTKVIRAVLKNDELTEIETLLLATPFSHGLFHYGGGMTFGNDGKLYVTVGERLFSESLEPELPVAQDVKDKRGKIYRLNSDGSIPTDNPDFGADAVAGIYAIGIRAAQGIIKHPQTGKIWFSEHGTIQGDEINVLEKGANYGWPIITTGKYRGNGYTPPKMEGVDFTMPVWHWKHTVAPTGLTFYTGDEFPLWENDLIVPGLSRGSLWRLNFDGEIIKSAEELFLDDRVRTRKAEVSPAGKLYILTDENNGRIIQIKNKL